MLTNFKKYCEGTARHLPDGMRPHAEHLNSERTTRRMQNGMIVLCGHYNFSFNFWFNQWQINTILRNNQLRCRHVFPSVGSAKWRTPWTDFSLPATNPTARPRCCDVPAKKFTLSSHTSTGHLSALISLSHILLVRRFLTHIFIKNQDFVANFSQMFWKIKNNFVPRFEQGRWR